MDLFYGRTVPQDYLKAVKNFEKAVKLGDGEGAYWLSHCYYFGLGVPQDIKRVMNFCIRLRVMDV